jgi:dihydropteroate synthase
LLIDPGFGFGKTLQHNLLLLKELRELTTLGVPLVAGLSRKSVIGKILDVPVDERVYGSIAAATLAAWQGARLIRVHDVRETRDALRIVSAVNEVEVDGLS